MYAGGIVRLRELEKATRRNKSFLTQHLAVSISSRRKAVVDMLEEPTLIAKMCIAQVIKVDKIIHLASIKNHSDLEPWENDWLRTVRFHNHELCNLIQYEISRLDHAFYVACRSFLERWTLNRASGKGLARNEKTETYSDFLKRVWDGAEVRPGLSIDQWWAEVSDVIHGVTRPDNGEAKEDSRLGITAKRVALEYSRLKIGYPRSRDTSLFIEDCYKAVFVVSKQFLASSLILVDLDEGLKAKATFLEPNIYSTSDFDWRRDLKQTLGPSDVISHYFPSQSEVTNSAYYKSTVISKSAVELLGVGYLDIDAVAALVHHRSIDLRRAVGNFHLEQKIIQDSSMEYFISSIFRYSTIAEMAIIVGRNIGGDSGDALIYAGFSLNSAWRVWLDDSDLNIAICRTVLEQSAKARAFRMKPEKSKLQAQRTYQPPNRWIELGGMKRLSKLNEALGEFCHYRNEFARPEARKVLIGAQGETRNDPVLTARTNLLLNTAYALAGEISEVLHRRYPKVSKTFEEEISLTSIEDKRRGFEKFLNDCLSLKSRGN